MFKSDKTKARPSGSGRVPTSGGIHALRCPPPPSQGYGPASTLGLAKFPGTQVSMLVFSIFAL